MSCTVSEILPLFSVCSSLRPWSPSVSIQQLQLQAVYAFRFIYKHIVGPMCYMFQGTGIERFHTAKVAFKVTKGHRYWRHSIGHIWFTTSLPLELYLCHSVLYCFEILSVISQNVKTSRDPEVVCHPRLTFNMAYCVENLKCLQPFQRSEWRS